MRPRRVIVRLHRWLALGLLLWVIIVPLLARGWWSTTRSRAGRTAAGTGNDGDVGPQAASTPRRKRCRGGVGLRPDAPRNGRGVYQVYAELYLPSAGDTRM